MAEVEKSASDRNRATACPFEILGESPTHLDFIIGSAIAAGGGMEHNNNARSASGFTLIETVIATSLFFTLVAGLAELFILSARFTGNSNRRGQAVMAAQAKIEDLRARRFGYDAEGDPITDPVLAPSPPATLHGDVAGYREALDSDAELIPAADGRIGTFARRWAIAPLDSSTPDALVIEVCVFREPATGAPLAAAEVCVSTIRSRQP